MTGFLSATGQILAHTVLYILFALELCMFIRSIISWLPIDEDNKISSFLAMVTEPFIVPVRALLRKMNWFQEIPLDVAFMVTFLLIILLESGLAMLL